MFSYFKKKGQSVNQVAFFILTLSIGFSFIISILFSFLFAQEYPQLLLKHLYFSFSFRVLYITTSAYIKKKKKKTFIYYLIK
jgi:hypothetical protein